MDVVAALIKKENAYLIAKRSVGNPNALGKWEFPGGKIEKHEDDISALKREIKEELNIEINILRYLTTSHYEYPNQYVSIKLYECEWVKGKIQLMGHSEYRFVNIHELLKYELCPADIALAKYIKEEKI